MADQGITQPGQLLLQVTDELSEVQLQGQVLLPAASDPILVLFLQDLARVLTKNKWFPLYFPQE